MTAGPSTAALPAVLARAARDPLKAVESMASRGDLVRTRAPGVTVWLANRPDLVEYVLAGSPDGFDKGRGVSKRFLGDSLLTLEGEEHQVRRAALDPGFAESVAAVRTEAVPRLADRRAARWERGELIDAQAEMAALNVEIAVECLFGVDAASDRGRALGAALEAASEAAASQTRRRRFARLRSELDSEIARIVAGARSEPGSISPSALTEILAAGLDDRQARDELVTMFSGHKSSGLALSWALHLLSVTPDADDRLSEELSVSPASRVPDAERLLTARASVAEAMRLRPPFWVLARRATQDHELEGQTVGEGSMVLVSQALMHTDPRFWERPDRYDPSRWIATAPDERPAFSYFPFGGGERDCLGRHFAWSELTLALAAFRRRWRLDPVPGREPVAQAKVSLRARDGIALRVAESR